MINKKSTTQAIRSLRKNIKNIERINFQRVDIDVLRMQLRNLMNGYMCRPLTHRVNSLVYRGRAFNRLEDMPHNIKDISTPPSHLLKNFQRASRPHHPMFYCSLSINAVPFELGAIIGQFIAFSTWQLKTEMLSVPTGYSSDTFKKLDSWRAVPDWLPSESDPVASLLQKFFSGKFTDRVRHGNEHMYKLSTAITEELLSVRESYAEDGAIVAGIQYPSIAMYADDDNLALFPEFVMNHMKLMHVEYGQLTGKPTERDFGFMPLDYADSFSEQGQIEWKGHPDYKHYEAGEQFMTKQNALNMGFQWNDKYEYATTSDGIPVAMVRTQPRNFSK